MFDSTGKSAASKKCFLPNLYVSTAAIRVAREPSTISHITAFAKRFEIIHPINRPGTAAGRNTGRMVRHSENRT